MKISIAPFCQYERVKEWPDYPGLMNLTDHKYYILGSYEETGIKRTLKESIEIIKSCDLFIGNDGGLYHIAVKLGIRVIVIFMKPENIFRVGHFNKPNVKIMWKPTLPELISCI